MSKNQFTFNDLPEVLGELCDRIASMESLLTEKLSKQNEVKENTHVPMTRAGGLRLSQNAAIDLLLQGQKG